MLKAERICMEAAVSAVDMIHPPLAAGGASLRRASRMRRLLGGFSILALIAASSARTATAQPVPSTPTDAIALLKWCWENRDVARYHELFANNYQYFYDVGNPAGVPYQATPWSRSDELVSSSNLFLGGGTKAPASSITLTFTDGPTLLPSVAGLAYPWHQQLEAQWTLDITCTDGSTLHGGGKSKWFVVRGDSAAIPQELKDRGFLPDPGRWYIERWLEEENTIPIVRAPSAVSGTPFIAITIPVTAWDPDGDPITSLIASVSGFTPTFNSTADHTAGTFIWVPLPTDIGTHGVTFLAANSLTGVATTLLHVEASNQPPNPALVVRPPGGVAPLSVTADASGSSDPEGQALTYTFAFGDGTIVGPQSSPTATHTYEAGNWTATVRVTDSYGATASISANVAVTARPVASVSVSPAAASVNVAATLQLTAIPQEASGNALGGRTITWASDNTAAATVNSSGLVTGVAPGSANITATCEGKSGSSAITVMLAPVASVSVSPASASIAPGSTKQLTATLKDAGGHGLTGRTISWASDNTAAATVDSSGLVTGVAAGSANVTATCEGKSGSSAIIVARVASVSVMPASANIAPGATQQLTATPKDLHGIAITGRSITWASDNTAAATVSSSGLVSGVAVGSANITATCEGKSGSSAITVIVVPVASVSVTPATASVTVGATQQLTATPKDASGNALAGRSITWASDNTAAATVSSGGLVTGVAVGSANITAICEGKSGSSAITVTTVTDPISSLPNLVTNPSFEADTAGWETFAGSLIERVPGGYDGLYALQMTGTTSLAWGFGVNDHPDWIHRTTAAGRRYRLTAWVRSAANHGVARIRVREYLLATGALLGQISSFGASLTPAWQALVVDYTTLSVGSSLDFQVKETPLVANEVFLTDDISIRDITGVPGLAVAQGEIESGPDGPAAPALSFRAAVYPSPVQSSAVLSFATSRPGTLRVDLLDLAGRAVRRLDDESESDAGMHTLSIDGIRDDGQRMSPGMYFYRIVADEGRLTGRFVLLK